MPFWKLILFVLGIVMVLQYLQTKFGVETFAGRACGAECPSRGAGGEMCHVLARDNCRIPPVTMNDCWLGTYRACVNDCARGGLCDCADKATAKCGSCDDPAVACYESVHQKCMAGMFDNVPDPDRG